MSDQRICRIHNEEGVAVDTNVIPCNETRFLCSRCLTEKFLSKHSFVWMNEIDDILKNMQSHQQKQKRSFIESQIVDLQTIHDYVQKYQETINNSLSKLIGLISDRIEVTSKQLNDESSVQKLDDENLNYLSKYMSCEGKFDQSEFIDPDEELDFVNIIKSQLENVQNGEDFKQIMNKINQISNNLNQVQETIKQTKEIEKQKINDHQKKSSALPYRCKKHDEKIRLFNIENQKAEERLHCLDCISETQDKLTTLKEANKMWLAHQKNAYHMQHKFQSQRNQQLQKITELIKKFEANYNQLIKELIGLISKQRYDASKELRDLELNHQEKNLIQLSRDEIIQATETLAQQDQLFFIKQQQSIKQDEDQVFYDKVILQLNQIEKNYNDNKSLLSQYIPHLDNKVNLQTLTIDQYNSFIQDGQLGSKLFSVVIPKLNNEFRVFGEVLQKTILQGIKFVHQLEISNKYQNNGANEQLISQYKQTLEQVESQYNFILTNTDFGKLKKQTQSSLTNNCFNQQESQIDNEQFEQLEQLQNFKYQQSLSVNCSILKECLELKSIQKVSDYKFSSKFKNKDISLSQDNKIAFIRINRTVCLIENPIPQQGQFNIDFRIQSEKVCVGICLKEFVQKDYYFLKYQQIEHGYYLLASDSVVFSNHNQQENCQKLGFEYSTGDLISVEVDIENQTIQWNNKRANKIYKSQIVVQNNSEVYFCVYTWDTNQYIEII